MFTRRFVVLPLVAGLLLAAAHAGDKVNLKLRLKPGDVHHLVSIVEQKIQQTLPGGNEQNIEQTVRFGQAFKAKSVDPNGIIELISTYDSIGFRMNAPMLGTLEYDSEKPKKDKEAVTVADVFSALLGKSLTVRLRPNGEVLEVRGSEELVTAMEKKLDEVDDPMTKMAFENVKEQFRADALKHTLQGFFSMFPDAPVATGETWNRKLDFGGSMPLSMNNTYKLRDVRGETAILEVRTDITTDPDEEVAMGPAKMSFDLKGDQQGTLDVDIKSGMVTGGKMKQTLKGDMRFGESPQGEMKIPMQIDSAITLKQPDAKTESAPSDKKADEKSQEKKSESGGKGSATGDKPAAPPKRAK